MTPVKLFLEEQKWAQKPPGRWFPPVRVLQALLNAQRQSTFPLGDHAPCSASLAIFPLVRQFAAVDAGWFEGLALPALQRWMAGWLAHHLFGWAMSKLVANRVVGL